jgi:penicillin amidase
MAAAALDRARLLSILRSSSRFEENPEAKGLSRADLDAAARAYLAAKVKPLPARVGPAGGKGATLRHDALGIPHIAADDRRDLFFAWGFATAADRLWQMDYLRRAARGTLPEIMGPDAVPAAIEVLTVGIGEIADESVRRLPAETLDALSAYSDGVNARMAEVRSDPPVEFELLEYECAPWSPTDTLAVMKHFWWQLTGRLFMMTGPETVMRTVGNDALYREFLRCEGGGMPIIPPGENRATAAGAPQPLGPMLNLGLRSIHSPLEAQGQPAGAGGAVPDPGSNNWALGPTMTGGRGAIFCSDPHTPYGAPSIWHQVAVRGAGFDLVGTAYVGMPGVLFGRNPRVAWGITNNICSQRDLFVLPAPAQDDSYCVGGVTHAVGTQTLIVPVRRITSHAVKRRVSDHGPIVNPLLPPPLASGRPVALRWVGAEPSDEIGTLLSVNRAGSAAELRESLRTWACPTFNFLCADADGRIAYQTVGRLPIRRTPHRGLRDLADPQQHWAGYFAYEQLPHAVDPKHGRLGTANNPVLPAVEDPGLGGQWVSDNRMRQLQRFFDRSTAFDLPAAAAGQTDVFSIRAAEGVPHLLRALGKPADPAAAAMSALAAWDHRMTADSAAATIWAVFSRKWTHAVYDARLDAAAKALLYRQGTGLIFGLLAADPHGWFPAGRREPTIRDAFAAALAELTAALGSDVSSWAWGRLHTITLRHPLGRLPNFGPLVNTGPAPVDGDGYTLNNQNVEAVGSYEASAGPCCRVAADLSRAELHMVNLPGNSGEPGSRHYRDQFEGWLAGRLGEVSG